MSKYIKLEDAIKCVNNIHHLADFIRKAICEEIEDIPSASEEELRKKYKDFYEQGKFDALVEVSEDAISRSALISFIDAGHLRNPNEKCYSENDVVELIKDAPSVVPSREEGEWIAKTEGCHSHWVCSECGAWALLEYNGQIFLSKYCPDCGTKMRV